MVVTKTLAGPDVAGKLLKSVAAQGISPAGFIPKKTAHN